MDIQPPSLEHALDAMQVNAIWSVIDRARGIVKFDLQGNIQYANENYLAMLGYRLEEIVGKHHSMLCDPAYVQTDAYHALWDDLRNGQAVGGDFKCFAKGGNSVWMQASYNPILARAGKPGVVVKFASDITAAKIDNAKLEGKVDAIDRSQGMIEFDLEGRILAANQNFLDIVGYRLDEVVGQHHSLFIEKAYAESSEYRDFWHKLRRGEFDAGAYKRVRKDGTRLWLHASYNPILDVDGKPFRVIKLATDITAAKMARADFEGKVNAIDHAMAMVEFDLDGNVLSANQNFLDIMGYRLDDVVGQHHSLFCDPASVQTKAYKDFWRKLRRGDFDAGEYRRLHKDGAAIWLQASYNPIVDADGKPYKIVKLASDVTAAKLVNAEFHGKVSAIDRSQAIAEFGLDGTILHVNQNFVDCIGYRLEEVVGKHHSMFCPPEYVESRAYQEFWNKLRRGEFDSGEYRRLAKDGSAVWIQATYNPIFDAEGKPYKVVKFATDVTVAKRANTDTQGKLHALDRSQSVVEFDLEGNILTANENFLSTLGYRLEEIRGKHHSIFCDSEYVRSAAYRDFWVQLGRGEYQVGRFLRLGKHDLRVWIQATYNPVFDADHKPFKVVKFATDITRQVETEERFQTRAKAMANAIEQFAGSISGIATTASTATTLAEVNMTDASAGVEALLRSVRAMSQIRDASASISGSVQVIAEIANQTNLLAFNAAIEAARAGEHGLGFSVVADEVRKLAEKSAQATRELDKLMIETVRQIEEGHTISKTAQEASGRMVTGIASTIDTIKEMNAMVSVQSGVANDVQTRLDAFARIALADTEDQQRLA